MNPYLKNLEKIEFVVTNACTGRCRHCSEGDHALCGERIDPALAADAVQRIAAAYAIKTVMAFGGEPLLYPDAVEAIMSAATAMKIPVRQVITNGYFSKSAEQIDAIAARLAACGVNDLLVSVDAFHQETIPLEAVKCFLVAAKACGIPTRISPAWLVSQSDDNPYNRQTRALLDRIRDLEIPVGEGNVIVPEGNAKRHLAAYFAHTSPKNPYVEDPRDLHCVSFSPDGGVLNGNARAQDIMEIIERYEPTE